MTMGSTLEMADVVDRAHAYESQFERIETAASGKTPTWLMRIRKGAIARFLELGFPTTRREEWRFTNVSKIADGSFAPAGEDDSAITFAQIEPFAIGDTGMHRLVFVNGRFAPALSTAGSAPDGVSVSSLAESLKNSDPALEPHLARFAKFDARPFVALNTALMQDGAFVLVARGKVIETPIHVLNVSTASQPGIVSYPRNLFVLESNSQATIVETYVGLGGATYFTNAVTEIAVKDNAVLDHYKIGQEGEGGLHIGMLGLVQHRSSTVTSHTVTLGGALVRNEMHIVLDGEGCESTLNGLYMVNGTQHVDNHLIVEHAKAHCNSREFFKGILDDHGKGIFTGRIIVREGAQKTDAKQTNQSLLLSNDAQVESNPQLEIYANDVRCTHGATIGQVDTEALFYLRSRGMSEATARSLLIYAFAHESIEHIRIDALRSRLDGLLFDRLPHTDLLREKV